MYPLEHILFVVDSTTVNKIEYLEPYESIEDQSVVLCAGRGRGLSTWNIPPIVSVVDQQ
jgi:hypothetical protein